MFILGGKCIAIFGCVPLWPGFHFGLRQFGSDSSARKTVCLGTLWPETFGLWTLYPKTFGLAPLCPWTLWLKRQFGLTHFGLMDTLD